jgi:hypothetical protein
VNIHPHYQPSSLLAQLLADQSPAELRALRTRLRGEIELDRVALGQKEADLREVERILVSRSGPARPVAKGKARRARAARRNGAAPVGGSLRQTILKIVGDDPGPWAPDDLFEALQERGAAPGGKQPMNTLRTRLREMAGRKEIRRVGRLYTRNDEEVSAM